MTTEHTDQRGQGLIYAIVTQGLKVVREDIRGSRPRYLLRPETAGALEPLPSESETVSDKIARWFKYVGVGSMRSLGITFLIIAAWLVLGQLTDLDPKPWLILLLFINLLEVPIMMVLQISQNTSERASNQRDLRDTLQTELLLKYMDEILDKLNEPSHPEK